MAKYNTQAWKSDLKRLTKIPLWKYVEDAVDRPIPDLTYGAFTQKVIAPLYERSGGAIEGVLKSRLRDCPHLLNAANKSGDVAALLHFLLVSYEDDRDNARRYCAILWNGTAENGAATCQVGRDPEVWATNLEYLRYLRRGLNHPYALIYLTRWLGKTPRWHNGVLPDPIEIDMHLADEDIALLERKGNTIGPIFNDVEEYLICDIIGHCVLGDEEADLTGTDQGRVSEELFIALNRVPHWKTEIDSHKRPERWIYDKLKAAREHIQKLT